MVNETAIREISYIQAFNEALADQITNNAAKMHYMFGGKVKIPLTIFAGTGAGTNSAAQHSETLYSLFTHFPGLKCVAPSDPYTAKGLLTASIRDDDPVIVFNNRQLMGLRPDGNVPEDSYESDGYSVEVIDLLSLSPMDEDTIINSVSKTRKVVIVDEDYPRCSMAGDISALVAEQAFDYLDAPPKRVTPPHTSVPYSKPLEALYVPTVDDVIAASLEVME